MDSFKTSTVFEKNLLAYNSKDRLIVNKGGTRSGKTYSILQLLFLIAFYSKKPFVISVVSYALPHLKLGAIRDFEKILLSFGIVPESVKNISESYFKINGSVIEFFGVENLGKVHGPERDILYVNECNYIKSYDIVRQLLVRTRGTAFMDYNPARLFWIDEEIIGKRECKIIHSTYLDNQHLTQSQIDEIESNKHNENWWRVYGLGEVGRLDDVILNNWEFGEFDNTLPFVYGLDFGSKHPDAMVKCAVDNARKIIYWQEKIYQSGLSTGQLIELIKSKGITNELIVADSAGKRTIQDLWLAKLNVRATVKNHIVDDIKTLWGYKIVVTPDSYNLAKNLNNWVWLDKKGEIPIDVDDDAIDAGRYAANILITSKPTRNMRLLK